MPVKRRPGSAPDRVVLDVEVEEQSTGELSFGAGYSTNEGIIGALYQGMYGDDLEVREASFYALEEISANGFKLPHPNQFGLG